MPTGQHRVECDFCGAKRKVRLRKAYYWTCAKCGEINIGPALRGRYIAQFLASKASPAGAAANGASNGTAVRTGTGLAEPAAPAAPTAPARVKPRLVLPSAPKAARPAPGPAASPTPPASPAEEKKPASVGGMIRGAFYG